MRHVCPGVGCSSPAGEGAPLQNPANRLDVNDDGFVSPVDVLGVVNHLNSTGTRVQSEGSGNGNVKMYVDVNGDRATTALDVLIIINYLNGRTGVQAEGDEIDVSGFGASHRLFNHALRQEPATSAVPLTNSRRLSRLSPHESTPFHEAKGDNSPHSPLARLRQITLEDDELTQPWEMLLDELAEDAALAQDLVPSV